MTNVVHEGRKKRADKNESGQVVPFWADPDFRLRIMSGMQPGIVQIENPLGGRIFLFSLDFWD